MFIFSSFLNRFQCIQKFLKKLCFCENCYVSTSSNISRILSRPCSFLPNSPGPNRDTGVRYNSNLNLISRSFCRSPAPVVRFCPQKLLQWLSAASVLQGDGIRAHPVCSLISNSVKIASFWLGFSPPWPLQGRVSTWGRKFLFLSFLKMCLHDHLRHLPLQNWLK